MPMPTRSLADLTRRREYLLGRLADPNLSDADTATLTAEAESVRLGLEAHAQRVRLLNGQAQHTGNADSDGGSSRPHGPATLVAAAHELMDSEQLAGFRANGYTGRAGLEMPATRALIDTGSSSGGAFQNPQRPSTVGLATPDRTPRVADLLDRRPTEQNNVEWVQDTSAAGGGSAAEVTEGALKPESTYTFAIVTDPVRTIAHWVNITRQALDDSDLLAQHVEGRLTYGLDYRTDAQILNGDGTAPNVRGILNASGIGTYLAAAGEAAVISVRRAMTVAQAAEVNPDGVVMNPTDWERIELSTDTGGMFRVSPSASGALAPRIWGLSVVATNAIAALTFLVGAFRYGATLWERSSALFVTDSHASNFTSNILTLLAERRIALSVMVPKAFVKGTFSTGTA